VINVRDYARTTSRTHSFELVVTDENGVERASLACGAGLEETFERFVESSAGNEGVILNLGERVANDRIVLAFRIG